MNSPPPYDLVIGLDRSDAKADLHLIDTRTRRRRSQTVDTSPEALREWLLELRQQHLQARVAVCLEQPAVHLLPFLESYAWITLYPINPLTLQKFREAFVTSRAKDDAQDAYFVAQLLLTHPDQLKPWAPEDSPTRAIQQLVAHRRTVVDERTGLTNRLQGLLKQYFPQALRLCGEDFWRPLATDFLLRWPSLPEVQKARPGTLQQLYYVQGSRSATLLAQRLELVAQAVPVTDETALIQSFALRVQLIARELQLLQQTITQYDRRLAEAFAQHEDHALFASLPGAGPVLAPRLLASLGSPRERFASAQELQQYSGVAPVTKKSGGTCHIHRRYLCATFQRQSFHEYAKESILWSRWSAAYYLQQRTKGSSHHTAVRALAFKWQRIIWRCWQNHTPYDERIYEAALRRSRSPLVKLLPQIEVGKSPCKNPGLWQNLWAKMAHMEVLNAAALLDNLAQGRAGAPSDEFFAWDHGLQVHPGGWDQVVTTTPPTFLACFWPKTGVFPVFWCNRLPTNSAMEAFVLLPERNREKEVRDYEPKRYGYQVVWDSHPLQSVDEQFGHNDLLESGGKASVLGLHAERSGSAAGRLRTVRCNRLLGRTVRTQETCTIEVNQVGRRVCDPYLGLPGDFPKVTTHERPAREGRDIDQSGG
jgi:transposase